MSKTCGRCHQPISPGQGYDTVIPDSGSTAAPTVYLHTKPCKRTPRQTWPTPIRR
ncbi:hypothetical protein [Streptomyces scabiei]|uniref:hypothetical protein n=1 Tax=Streptomyces scabiei TaxID=1930 RepID=UPI000B085857|nr:hypothetical protein [Streptomyces scabiei]MDX3679524.1 hypothetical protein [Streptomyces scabiei]